MNNKVFWKAIGLLSQPVSLGAIGLLLINDRLLREVWPSWWTGKIGDFAWLFFFPFLLAVFLAWLIPPQLSYQEKMVRWLAFGLTGSVFTLAKTFPSFHDLTIRIVETVLSLPVTLKRDPTDLIALVSLGVGWWFWKRQPVSSPSWVAPGWIALLLAVLLTMGNAPPTDWGIDSLVVEDQTIVAHSNYGIFTSEDGGLSWQRSHIWPTSDSRISESTGRERYAFGTSSGVPHRFTPGVVIEVSEDGGKTWPHEFSLSPAGQAARAYYERRKGSPVFKPGPLDAVVDPVTRNIIFAMGHEGVLVFKANAEWVWVPVGDYSRFEFDRSSVILFLLVGEILLAVGFGLLSVVTLTLGLHHGWPRIVLVGVGWVCWGLNAAAFPPTLITGPFFELIVTLDYILLSAGVLLVGFLALSDILIIAQHSRKAVFRLAAVGLGGIFLFFLPYIFWAFNVLPSYMTAVLFALGLGAVTLLVGRQSTYELLKPITGK
jgi:hypothetical protein